MKPDPLAEKWRALGWHVAEVNGHDYDDLLRVGVTLDWWKSSNEIATLPQVSSRFEPRITREQRAWCGWRTATRRSAGQCR